MLMGCVHLLPISGQEKHPTSVLSPRFHIPMLNKVYGSGQKPRLM